MLQQSTPPTIEPPWNFIRPVRDKTMVLPLDFVSKHGEGLSAVATITVANGDKWKIGLNKFGVVDEEEVRVKIRLEDKFDKFLEYYSVETNKENLIHFKYKGMSEFEVSIHHENGNEIKYGSPQRSEEPKQQNPKKRMNENEPCSHGNPKRVVVEKESQCQVLGEDEFLKLLQNPNIYVSNKLEANFTNETRTRAVSLFKKIKPEGPCFLTPMLKSSSSCLFIGAEFVRKYLIKSNEVMLQVCGSEDKRSFTYLERNGAFCITKGWGNFVKENDLVEGDILILELISTQEDATLLKVFMDHCYDVEKEKESQGMSEFDMNTHHENGNGINYSPQGGCSLRFKESKRQNQVKRMNESRSPVNGKRFMVEKESGSQSLGEDEFTKLLQVYPNIYLSNKHGSIFTNEARTRAVSFIKKIKPKGPCYLSPMLKSNLGCLFIGAEFARKYLAGSKEAMLQVSGSVVRRSFNFTERRGGACFSKGWSNFVEENDLVEGDILILELISTEEDATFLKVFIDHCYEVENESQGMLGCDRSIHRENGNGINYGSQGGCSQRFDESRKQNQNKRMSESCPPMNGKRFMVEKESESQSLGNKLSKLLQNPNIYVSNKYEANFTEEARTRAISFIRRIKPKGPCFLAPMLESNASVLWIEAEFASKYLIGSDEVIFQCSWKNDQRSLSYLERQGGACFTKGWKQFVEENEFVEGDILIFELISTREEALSPVLKVFVDTTSYEAVKKRQIQGEDELSKLLKENPNIHVNKLYKAKFNAEAKARAVSLIKRIKPNRPCLLSMFSKSNAYGLWIGSEFARKYLRGTEEVILEVPDGDCWPISLEKRDDSAGGFLREGWRIFVEENRLVEGDILILELITSQDDATSVLEVFIDHCKSK